MPPSQVNLDTRTALHNTLLRGYFLTDVLATLPSYHLVGGRTQLLTRSEFGGRGSNTEPQIMKTAGQDRHRPAPALPDRAGRPRRPRPPGAAGRRHPEGQALPPGRDPDPRPAAHAREVVRRAGHHPRQPEDLFAAAIDAFQNASTSTDPPVATRGSLTDGSRHGRGIWQARLAAAASGGDGRCRGGRRHARVRCSARRHNGSARRQAGGDRVGGVAREGIRCAARGGDRATITRLAREGENRWHSSSSSAADLAAVAAALGDRQGAWVRSLALAANVRGSVSSPGSRALRGGTAVPGGRRALLGGARRTRPCPSPGRGGGGLGVQAEKERVADGCRCCSCGRWC
jgi:hypothetical protein